MLAAQMRPLLLLLVLLAFVVGCSVDDPDGATIWRFAIEEPVGSVQWAYAERFKQLIEDRTDGRIEVQVYPYGTLGTSDHVTELLRMGTVHFATASPGHLGKLIPEVQVMLLHFVFSDEAEVNREALRDPELRQTFDTLYRDKGFRLLSVFQEGWQVWTTRKEIRAPQDFSGVRMRVMTSPMLIAAYEAYGASPTPLPYGEVYSALQLNMIDGQVNPIFAIQEMSFYEVTDYLVFANHLPFVTTVASNERHFEALSPELRQLVLRVIDELQDHVFEVQSRFNAERLDLIRQRKPEIRVEELTEDERARFRQASLGVRDTFVQRVGPNGQNVLNALLDAVARQEAQPR